MGDSIEAMRRHLSPREKIKGIINSDHKDFLKSYQPFILKCIKCYNSLKTKRKKNLKYVNKALFLKNYPLLLFFYWFVQTYYTLSILVFNISPEFCYLLDNNNLFSALLSICSYNANNVIGWILIPCHAQLF